MSLFAYLDESKHIRRNTDRNTQGRRYHLITEFNDKNINKSVTKQIRSVNLFDYFSLFYATLQKND